MFKSHLASINDADTIQGHVKTVVAKVDTIFKKHQLGPTPAVRSGCWRLRIIFDCKRLDF
jgi:hypothetical protein